MSITLFEWPLFTTEHRGRARWDHDLNILAVRRDGVVGGSAIISTVSCYPRDPVFNLIQQRRHPRGIIGVLIREGLRDYHATASIDRQMEFAPFATGLRARVGASIDHRLYRGVMSSPRAVAATAWAGGRDIARTVG